MFFPEFFNVKYFLSSIIHTELRKLFFRPAFLFAVNFLIFIRLSLKILCLESHLLKEPVYLSFHLLNVADLLYLLWFGHYWLKEVSEVIYKTGIIFDVDI